MAYTITVEDKQIYETWDTKKIFTLIIIAVILGLSIKTFFLEKNSGKLANRSVSVQGESTQILLTPTPSPSEELKKNVESKLNDLKKEVNNINLIEVATSTPAVKKVISDLKNLQNLPQTQAKEACVKICSSL